MRTLIAAGFLIASASAAELRITLYDGANLAPAARRTVIDTVHEIFRAAAIDAMFVTGDPASTEASLLTFPQTPAKGREREAGCRARRDIALEIVPVAPQFQKSTALGTAQPLAKEGLNARVFDDRIRDAANGWNRSHEVVLAYAIAHEIGHVLLRSVGHGPAGLMAGVWGNIEYQQIAHSQLLFTVEQSRAMRQALAGAGCPNETVARTVPSRR